MSVPEHNEDAGPSISFDEFLKVDVRVGTIVRVEPYKTRRNPKVPRRLTMTMTFFNEGDNAAA